MRLAGARILITGGSSGIGAATATLLAQHGAQVLLTGRDSDALKRLATETGGNWFTANLLDPPAVERIADWVQATADGVDILICNAGIGYAESFIDTPGSAIDDLIAVNITASVKLTRLLLPNMVRAGRGHVVFVSSIAGFLGVANETVYSATKGALRTFADSLRLELSDAGLGITTVAPGIVDTPFFDRRGRAYERNRPKPVPASKVAAALIRAIERNQPEVFIPAWLRFPARLHGLAPVLVQNLERRFG